MSEETDSEWTARYDDRYGKKLIRGDDEIKLSRPHEASDGDFEVVGYIGDRVYHTTHARENEALDRVAMLTLFSEREPTFESGERVYVVSDSFTPVVQEAHVGFADSHTEGRQSIDVMFDTDPFDADSDEGRVIGCDPSEMLHADAGTVEVLRFIGRDDLLEWEDFVSPSDHDSTDEQGESDFAKTAVETSFDHD